MKIMRIFGLGREEDVKPDDRWTYDNRENWGRGNWGNWGNWGHGNWGNWGGWGHWGKC